MKCLTGIAIPDTLECGEKALAVLVSKIPPGKLSNALSLLSMAGLAIVPNPVLREDEIHVVSYRREGGQTVRTLHKIFNLEVS